MALFTNRLTVWVAFRDFVAFIALYIVGLQFLPRLLFLEILNAMLAAISISVVVIYATDVPNRIRENKYGVALIRIGIVLGWLVSCVQALGRFYFFMWRPEVTGRTFDSLRGLPAMLLIVAAALHIVAIGMVENRYVRRNMCVVIWSLFVGAVAVAIVKGVQML